MTINWQLWKKPENGGVLIVLTCFVIFCLFLFIRTLVQFEITQTEMANTSAKTKMFSNQIKAVENYEKLQQLESQKFSIFKRKKWDKPLTQELLNQSIYAIQKQANVEFLFIQPKSGINKVTGDQSTPQKITIILLVKVLRDQSFFNFLQKLGKVEHQEMHRTFNCGIGMVLVVDKNDVAEIVIVPSQSIIIKLLFVCRQKIATTTGGSKNEYTLHNRN